VSQKTRPTHRPTQPSGRPAATWWPRHPRHASALFGWSILPLRAFLGFTFTFAGLQKLANPNFFNANSSSSIHAQLIAAIRVSPLHGLLAHFLAYATPIGVLIAVAEVAVGLGTLCGLWTRLAAVGGLILSLTLFMTVSFHSSPYYTGSDIVFCFAWLPLIVGGAGDVLSLDALFTRRAAADIGEGSPQLVPITFDLVQRVCGHYDDGRCTARARSVCEPAPCPFLAQGREPLLARGPDAIDRRSVVIRGTAAAAVGAVGLVGAGAVAGVARAIGGAKAPAGGGEVSLSSNAARARSTSNHPPGRAIGPAKDVPVGGAAQFTDPSNGRPGLVLQPTQGTYLAYNAICPHAGCTVGYYGGSKLIVCPCHGSVFNPTDGSVESGPAQTGLGKLRVAVGSDGQLYVNG
jgi:thiosulfate dehydrogenase [quinone] large subunit